MSYNNNALGLALIDDIHEVSSDLAGGVVLKTSWFGRPAVTKEVGRDDSVTSLGEKGRLVAPVIRGGGEAVHKEQRELGSVLGRGNESVVGVPRLGQDVFVRAGVHG